MQADASPPASEELETRELITKAASTGEPLMPKQHLAATSVGPPAENRRVDGQWLGELLGGRTRTRFHPRGLNLTGLTVTGISDWSGIDFDKPLMIERCTFEDALILNHASLRSLRLIECELKGFIAQHAEIHFGLALDGCEIEYLVQLHAVNVGKDLTAVGTHVRAFAAHVITPEDLPPAVSIINCNIGGNLELRDDFFAGGQVNLVGTRVQEQINLSGATIHNRTGLGLICEGVVIGAGAYFRRGFQCNGGVVLDRISVGGPVSMEGAQLHCESGLALSAIQMKVASNVELRGLEHAGPLVALGGIELQGSHVIGSIFLENSFVSRTSGAALGLGGITVEGDVLIEPGSVVQGGVNLNGARIEGELSISASEVSSTQHSLAEFAVAARYLRVRGDLSLSMGTRLRGGIDISSAELGSLLIHTAYIENSPERPAIQASGCQVHGSMLLGGLPEQHLIVVGQIALTGARVAGFLMLLNARVYAQNGVAIHAGNLTVGADIRLGPGVATRGRVALTGLEAGGDVRFEDVDILGRGTTDTSYFEALNLSYARITGQLQLGPDFSALGRILMQAARVFSVIVTKTDLIGSGGVAVDAQQLGVAGDLRFGNGEGDSIRIRGATYLTGATVGGTLHCERAHFQAHDGIAFAAEGAKVGGELRFVRGCQVTGAVLLNDLSATSLLVLGGSFSSWGRPAIVFNSAHLTGDLRLNGMSPEDPLVVRGGVHLTGGSIGGDVRIRSTSLSDTQGIALNADQVHVIGGMILSSSVHLVGTLTVVAASIGGNLVLSDVTSERSIGQDTEGFQSVLAHQIRIRGQALITDSCLLQGMVHLNDGDLGSLVLRDSEIRSGNAALSGQHLRVSGDVRLEAGRTKHLTLSGAVHLDGARINGRLVFANETFCAISTTAIAINDAQVAGDVIFTPEFIARGSVEAAGLSVGGSLYFLGCICVEASCDESPGAVALFAEGMKVRHSLHWKPMRVINGKVDLRHAAAGRLDDDASMWPSAGRLRLQGFAFESLASIESGDARRRLSWVRSQQDYAPEPYSRLAAAYRRSGHEAEARKILIAKQDDLRRYGSLPFFAKWWNRVLGVAVGHGYKAWRIAATLPVLYAISVFMVMLSASSDEFIPTRQSEDAEIVSSECRPDYPCLSPLIYPIDTIVPVVNLNQRDYWQPAADSGLGALTRAWLTFATLSGWAATTLLVVTYTGIVKKE